MGLGLVFLPRGHPRSGRPFLAASPFSEKNFAPGWPRNGDHEVGRPRPSPQSSPLSHIQSAFTLPMYFRSRYCISTEHKLIRFSRNPPRNPGRAPPTMALLLSALSMGHLWARCMLVVCVSHADSDVAEKSTGYRSRWIASPPLTPRVDLTLLGRCSRMQLAGFQCSNK